MIRIALLLLLCLSGAARAAETPKTLTVEVLGLQGPLLANVRASLSIEQQKSSSGLSDWLVRRLHDQAPAEIRRALEAYGYYRPSIEASLLRTPGGWLARYRIEPGPPVPIAAIAVHITGPGENDPAFKRYLETFPLRPGEPAQSEPYERAKRELQRLALDRGYLDARLVHHELRIDLQHYTAQVVLDFDTGPQYRFGPVTLEQNTFRPAFLMGYVHIKPGDPYSTSALIALQNALADSDYFREVQVIPRRDLARGREIPIIVKLVPRTRSKYTFGLGYGTDTGPRGSLGWERRWTNDEGHRFNAELQASEIRDSLSARYLIPLRDPIRDRLALSTSLVREHFDDTRSRSLILGVSRITALRRWQQTLSFNFQQDSFDIGAASARTTLLLPGINLLRIQADNRIYTNDGSLLGIDLTGTDPALGSDTGLVRARLQAKLIHRWTSWGRTILRAEAGVIAAQDFAALPPSLRFYAGGDQSVRGYAYNSLGPQDANGDVIGGDRLLVLSAEYDQRLTQKWSAAVFYDAGNAMNSFSGALRRGAGVGLRWRSPVGPIRLDLAKGLDLPGEPWRVHISIGPDL